MMDALLVGGAAAAGFLGGWLYARRPLPERDERGRFVATAEVPAEELETKTPAPEPIVEKQPHKHRRAPSDFQAIQRKNVKRNEKEK